MKSFIGGRFGLVVNQNVIAATQNSFAYSPLVLKLNNSLQKYLLKTNVDMLHFLLGSYFLHTSPTPLNKNLTVSADFFTLLQSDFFAKYTLFQIKTAKTVMKYSTRNTESELKKRYFYIFRRFHYVWEKYLFLPTREVDLIDDDYDENGEVTKPISDLNSILTRVVEYRINRGFLLAKKFKWNYRFRFRRLKWRRIKYFGTNTAQIKYNLANVHGGEDSDFNDGATTCKRNLHFASHQPTVVYKFYEVSNKPNAFLKNYKPFRLFYKNISKKEFNLIKVRKKYHAYYLHKTFEYTYNRYWVDSIYDLVLNCYALVSQRELPYFLKNRKITKPKHQSLFKWFEYLFLWRCEIKEAELIPVEVIEVIEVKTDQFEIELPNFFADPVEEFIFNNGDFFDYEGGDIIFEKETLNSTNTPRLDEGISQFVEMGRSPHTHLVLKIFDTFFWDISDDTPSHIDDVLYYDYKEIIITGAFGFTSIGYDEYNYRFNIWICMITLDPVAYRQGRLRFPRTLQEIYEDFLFQLGLRLKWKDFFLPKLSREGKVFQIFSPWTPRLRVISKRRAKQTKKRAYKQRHLTPAKKQKKLLNKFVKFFFANKFDESSVWFFRQFYDAQLYPFKTHNFWYNIFIDEMFSDIDALNDRSAATSTLCTSNIASQKYLKLWAFSNYNPVVLTPHRFRQVVYDRFHKTSARVDSKYLQFYLNNFISYWAGMRSFVILQSNLSLKNQNFSNTLFNIANYLLDYFSKIHVKFFKKFPIESFVEFFTFSMFKKDLNYFVEFFKYFVEETHLKEHKKIFSSFEFMLKKFLYKVMVWTHVQGIKFEISGKISVTGNAKKRRKIIKIGYYSLTHKKLKIDYLLDTIRTSTGVLGFRTFITY